MIFDQYSRYKACSDLIHQVGFVPGSSVLDIGSGPECLFGHFMPDAAMTYVDPLIPSGSGDGRITGDVFANELDGKYFDCVSAVDVLEHVPSEHRKAFLERLSSLGKDTLILGFPTSDSSDALKTDKAIDDQYRTVFSHDYSWLEEHYWYGLPSLAETVAQLSRLGWHCQAVGHGHAPWLRELLGFVVCVWDIPSLGKVVQAISEKFNRELYPYDFRPPHYRQFVIACRSPLQRLIAPATGNDAEKADGAFRELIEEAQKLFFIESLRQISERDAQISILNQKVEEVSVWVSNQQATLTERDAQITSLNQSVEEVSVWASNQQATLTERDAQITTLKQKVEELSVETSNQQATLSERDAQIVALSQSVEQNSSLGMSQHEKIASLEKALSDKHAELMKMSDWAFGMMQEVKALKSTPHIRAIKRAKEVKSTLRRKVADSLVGDLVRHVRDSRWYRPHMMPLETIKASVNSCNGRLIITFPITTWDFRWQRPQHIVSRLRDRGFSVLYLAMSLTAYNRRFRSIREAGAALQFNNLVTNVNQIWLHSQQPLNIYTDLLEGGDLHNIVMGMTALLNELKPQSIQFLIQFPGWWPVAKALKEQFGGQVMFDCMDDHGAFSTNTAQALKTEHELIQQADLVVTSSSLLEERCKILNPKTIQVKNGTEFEHFANPQRNGTLDAVADKPIIGYFGAISDWFDMEIVAFCARSRPDWNFVLIGATVGADLNPVGGLSNVQFLGEKPYTELPGFLAYFDICIIPFKIIPLTLATNPVKFYEYLSAGKPVVSVNLPELIPYADDCYLASSPGEFLAQLVQAMAERSDSEKARRRIHLAKENSWDSRVDVLMRSTIDYGFAPLAS